MPIYRSYQKIKVRKKMQKPLANTLIHLRFAFSFFLLPIFLLSVSGAKTILWPQTILLFAVLHFLVYPSSNGYNSLQDNDIGSIGGLKNPPKVPGQMLWVTIFLDVVSLALTVIFISPEVAALLLLYIFASRMYSYRGIRLKKLPIVGFLTVGIFQGPVIYALSTLAITQEFELTNQHILGCILAFLMIAAGYPLTQIYQHKQDAHDGVKTLSMMLGIRGTFIFSGVLFALLGVALATYSFAFADGWVDVALIVVCLLPAIVHFNKWLMATFKNTAAANYENTMKMNKLGGISLNLLFLIFALKNLMQFV